MNNQKLCDPLLFALFKLIINITCEKIQYPNMQTQQRWANIVIRLIMSGTKWLENFLVIKSAIFAWEKILNRYLENSIYCY